MIDRPFHHYTLQHLCWCIAFVPLVGQTFIYTKTPGGRMRIWSGSFQQVPCWCLTVKVKTQPQALLCWLLPRDPLITTDLRYKSLVYLKLGNNRCSQFTHKLSTELPCKQLPWSPRWRPDRKHQHDTERAGFTAVWSVKRCLNFWLM